MTISREEAIVLLNSYIKNGRMLNHCYAAEAVMTVFKQLSFSDLQKRPCLYSSY